MTRTGVAAAGLSVDIGKDLHVAGARSQDIAIRQAIDAQGAGDINGNARGESREAKTSVDCRLVSTSN